MSVSNQMIFGAQAAGNKSTTLLAGLSADNGAGNRLGQDFSQMLKTTLMSPAMAPPPYIEPTQSPTPTAAVPPKPEQAREAEGQPNANRAEQAQAAPPTSPASKADAPKADASNADARDSVPNTDQPPASSKAADQTADTKQTDAAKAGASKSIKRLAAGLDAQDLTAQDLAASGIVAVQHLPAEPKPADSKKKADLASPDAGAADPQSLASLMPSVAQAVFRQDSLDQAAGAIKSDAKATASNSASERAKALSAKKQDTAALLDASASASGKPLEDLVTLNPELTRTFGGDKPPGSNAPDFSKLMQAAGAVAGPLSGPINTAASQNLSSSTPVQMRSDLQGPGFAPEMAARLTVLAGAGVQKAELHLNPAEMGPVSVHILLDGQDAQVQFHAQHAVTREVLERSLPELAAALRDAGMTLSGGGVFQQQQDARQDAQAQNPSHAQGQSRSVGSDVGTGRDPVPLTVRHTQVGVLDMYA